MFSGHPAAKAGMTERLNLYKILKVKFTLDKTKQIMLCFKQHLPPQFRK